MLKGDQDCEEALRKARHMEGNVRSWRATMNNIDFPPHILAVIESEISEAKRVAREQRDIVAARIVAWTLESKRQREEAQAGPSSAAEETKRS